MDKPKHPGGRPKGSLGVKNRTLLQIHHDLEAEGKADPNAVVAKLYEMAAEGNMAAVSEYLNRRFGKAVDVLDMTTREGKPEWTPEEQKEREARVLAFLQKKRDAK